MPAVPFMIVGGGHFTRITFLLIIIHRRFSFRFTYENHFFFRQRLAFLDGHPIREHLP